MLRAAGAKDRTVYLLFHFPGSIVEFKEGSYFSTEGIPRVMRKLVHAILRTTDLSITVTCTRDNLTNTLGFFAQEEPSSRGRLQFLVIDDPGLFRQAPSGPASAGPGPSRRTITGLVRRILTGASVRFWRWRTAARINADEAVHSVLVPHYYCFPEAALMRHAIWLYVPDFIPHFFQNRFDSLADRWNRWVGSRLSRRAARIITNSQFTRAYLPATALGAPANRIAVLPLPLLTPRFEPEPGVGGEGKIAGRYLFYPTQNRANKNLDFALGVLHELRKTDPGLRLVLTCRINDYPPMAAALRDLGLAAHVDLRPSLADGALRRMYENAEALLFTSSFEGNFPPQVFEALSAGIPVIASDIPMIREVLGEASDALELVRPLDLEAFVAQARAVLNDRKAALIRQAAAYVALQAKAGEQPFFDAVESLYRMP